MSEKRKRKLHKRHVLALSVCVLIASILLGTGASLAWFSAEAPEVENIFHVADFDLDVQYKNGDSYYSIGKDTKIFNEQALYEPGYVQVVYLKIENKGERAFDFKTAVTVTGQTVGTNVYGQPFYLKDHLRFGMVTDSTEAGLMAKVDTRAEAAACATRVLGNYESGLTELGSEQTMYAAVVIAMPEQIGNEANYRGDTVPQLDLGITVTATQIEAR